MYICLRSTWIYIVFLFDFQIAIWCMLNEITFHNTNNFQIDTTVITFRSITNWLFSLLPRLTNSCYLDWNSITDDFIDHTIQTSSYIWHALHHAEVQPSCSHWHLWWGHICLNPLWFLGDWWLHRCIGWFRGGSCFSHQPFGHLWGFHTTNRSFLRSSNQLDFWSSLTLIKNPQHILMPTSFCEATIVISINTNSWSNYDFMLCFTRTSI